MSGWGEVRAADDGYLHVLHLTTDKMVRVNETPDLRRLISARRAQRARHEQVQLPGAWRGRTAACGGTGRRPQARRGPGRPDDDRPELVVESGGALNAAAVARELGVPCVVNPRVRSKAMRTGDLVRVNGSTGRVDILERAA